MLRRCATRYPSHFKLMLADQLEMQQATKLSIDLTFSLFSVLSKVHSDETQCVAVKILLKGVEVGPYNLCLLNGDNIGSVIKEEDASYT